MDSIHETYISALLADASYTEGLVDGLTAQPLTDLLSLGMTPALATFVGNNFEVVANAESNDVYASGFDATTWRGRPNTPYAGKIMCRYKGRWVFKIS